jgi:putative N6-adenine-specific DNA methylase
MVFPESALMKRIRRHVIGRVRTYFAATAPGLENICLKELLALSLTTKAASTVAGGVTFKGRLQDCYLANLNLRTANRILMRIQSFKATNFRQFEKKLQSVPWELYIRSGQPLKVTAAAIHCRLYHTQAISERLSASISERLRKTADSEEIQNFAAADQRIFVRGSDDFFTLSIDSSGDNLYKRGIKKHSGRAPLRENLAAAALLQAGYKGSEPLVDPMCGSGTFSLEAGLMAKNIPPGWFRDFAFMTWPSFQSQRWKHLKRQSEKTFIHPKRPLIFASDKNPEACRRLEKCTPKFGLADAISVCEQDFFDLAPDKLATHPGTVAINPPYGHRMGTVGETTELFQAVCKCLGRRYKGWKLALIVPDKRLLQFVPFKMKSYSISHGGLKLSLVVGRIS